MTRARWADRLERVLQAGVVRVGTTIDTPVFSMQKVSGDLHGFDMDVLATLESALGADQDKLF